MAKKTKLERDLERFFTKTLPDTADKAKKDISKGLQKAGKEVVKAWKIVKKETNPKIINRKVTNTIKDIGNFVEKNSKLSPTNERKFNNTCNKVGLTLPIRNSIKDIARKIFKALVKEVNRVAKQISKHYDKPKSVIECDKEEREAVRVALQLSTALQEQPVSTDSVAIELGNDKSDASNDTPTQGV